MTLIDSRAIRLSAATTASDQHARLNAEQLGRRLAPLLTKADYLSESNYAPQYISTNLLGTGGFTGPAAVRSLKADLREFFGSDATTSRTMSSKERAVFLKDLNPSSGHRGFKPVLRLLDANLTDLTVIKTGPIDPNTGKLARDNGLYGYLVVGKTCDGKVAGILIGAVET
jgi:hypothetical protein